MNPRRKPTAPSNEADYAFIGTLGQTWSLQAPICKRSVSRETTPSPPAYPFKTYDNLKQQGRHGNLGTFSARPARSCLISRKSEGSTPLPTGTTDIAPIEPLRKSLVRPPPPAPKHPLRPPPPVKR